MPEYLAPGVYVEEVPSSIKPIVGVSTSTAAFVGIIAGPTVDIPEDNPDYDPTRPTKLPSGPGKADGENLSYRTWKFPAPDADVSDAQTAFNATIATGSKPPRPADTSAAGLANFRKAKENLAVALARKNAGTLAEPRTPVLCTTFAEFKRSFGDFSTDPDQRKLAHGVFGFFNNGGTRCWVMRFEKLDKLQEGDALQPFEAIDEISIVAAPGVLDDAVQANLIDHCENMSDRVAILDTVEDPGPNLDVKSIQGNITNTDYGALYFPWIKVFDINTKLTHPDPSPEPYQPHTPDQSDDGEIYVAPSGHIAGLWARVDDERGVHKAPANEPIRGALGLEYQISKSMQAGLNPHGINAIRNINGKFNVWGARTIGGDMNFDTKYINVRRTLIFIRKSIDEGTQWVVFEPNAPDLWAKIIRNVSAFLTNVWRDGALFGLTPQEAFYVKCDAETNPPEVRDLGQVVTEIGVAIVLLAEFVIFRIQQWSGPASQ